MSNNNLSSLEQCHTIKSHKTLNKKLSQSNIYKKYEKHEILYIFVFVLHNKCVINRLINKLINAEKNARQYFAQNPRNRRHLKIGTFSPVTKFPFLNLNLKINFKQLFAELLVFKDKALAWRAQKNSQNPTHELKLERKETKTIKESCYVLSKSYLTVIGISIQSLKSIGKF